VDVCCLSFLLLFINIHYEYALVIEYSLFVVLVACAIILLMFQVYCSMVLRAQAKLCLPRLLPLNALSISSGN